MSEQREEYFIDGSGAKATGFPQGDGFLIKAGAVARKEMTPSALDTNIPVIRERLLGEGVLVDDGEELRFVKDYVFNSSSAAAEAVLARSQSGPEAWRDGEGLTLKKRTENASDGINSAGLLKQNASHSIQKITLLKKTYEQLVRDGAITGDEKLDEEYALFREKFAPEVLSKLDGEELLVFMHDHGNPDSLVYWLEFKNDDEFGTRKFGSIAGGSALKFRLFKRKDTGQWQAGIKSGNRPENISLEKAIGFARAHRDQLINGCRLLEELPSEASDADYAGLQTQMDQQAGDVSRLAFGHKYFSMLFSEKLDDFHSPKLQRFHLLKLLMSSDGGEGRYVCAGQFARVAKQVGLRMNHFTYTLLVAQGGIHKYWRILVASDVSMVPNWETLKSEESILLGWDKLDDLNWMQATRESRRKLVRQSKHVYADREAMAVNDARSIGHFVAGMSEGDIVVALDGTRSQAIGRVVGGYEYQTGSKYPHRRRIEWLDEESWMLPAEGLKTKGDWIKEIGNSDNCVLAIEDRIQEAGETGVIERPKPLSKYLRLAGIEGRIQSVLERKGQIILYGPPGTGKTYWAERTAQALAAQALFGKPFDELSNRETEAIQGTQQSPGAVRMCCFHPAYGYEDFLEGYRPTPAGEKVAFQLRDGVFKALCKDALEQPDQKFYLIVDEINRGDIPRIFGELLTTLEKDKRGKRIILPVSQEPFFVPPNVFLIGTMNTADRSISLLDAALRRRFGFMELMPDGGVLGDAMVSDVPLRAWFNGLNEKIREHVGRDARNLQIGHSYLMHAGTPLKEFAPLMRAVRDDILPLLQEYCYEDYGTLEKILGQGLVDTQNQTIRHELFLEGRESELKDALLAICPDASATTDATAADQAHAENETDLDSDEVRDSLLDGDSEAESST